MTCPSCGKPNPDEARFCLHCATPLGAGVVAASVDPQRAALERALGAQYDIQRLLGRGGMGAVYLARERSLDRLVAIKILPPETAADADNRERFRREARTAAKLTHPNIVPLYAFGDVDGMLYFVMGYVRGESLADRMRREGKLPADQVRRILKEVADALEHAHRHGIVHRDIKPDNVLLDDETGRPMLTDFGVAKGRAAGATLTATGMIVGTPLYMSPEQASGSAAIDGRSDLYSLGALAYAMLAGRPPFDGTAAQDLIVQHLTREPPPLEALAPDAPRDLVAAVTKCLAKDPALRWTDARSLAAELGNGDADADEPSSSQLAAIDGGLFGLASAGCASIAFLRIGAAVRGMGDLGADVASILFMLGRAGFVVMPMAYAGFMYMARRRGHTWQEIKSAVFAPPRWWGFWWPKPWRRRGDVWDRLPALLRRNRALRTIGLGLMVTTALTAFGSVTAKGLGVPHAVIELVGGVFLLQFGGVVATFIGASYQVEKWGRTLGFDARQSALTAERPTDDLAFWRKPRYAALLEPVAATRPAPVEPQSPPDYAAAIGAAARQFTDPLRQLGRDAEESARHLVAAIAALDGEIGQLARDASPADIAAIEQKLAVLGDAAGDNDARRQMRALLASQRDLLRKLAGQLEAASARRERFGGLLKALWLQVANLRAQAAADTVADTEISGRIRAICGEIDNQAAAIETVNGITRNP